MARISSRIEPEETSDGVGYCPLCDLVFSLEDERDVADHHSLHTAFEQVADVMGAPMTSRECAAAECIASEALNRHGATPAERVTAAVLLVRVQHQKCIRECVRGGREGRLLTEQEFIAAADLESAFAPDVVKRLRQRFGSGPAAGVTPFPVNFPS